MVQNVTVTIPTMTMDPIALEELVGTYDKIPLTELSNNTRLQLSMMLNSKKMLRSEEGFERDWRGIAVLIQQKNLIDDDATEPMSKVLNLWCRNCPVTATFANLINILGRIDRWDVSDDIMENLALDATNFNEKQKRLSARIDETDTAEPVPGSFKDNPNILTCDDMICAQNGQPPQKYDAFLLYSDKDEEYAREIIIKLEDRNYNFKICLKDRLLPGIQFIYEALAQLVEERCHHLIVIITRNFEKSPEDEFLLKYTQALQIEKKTRKIIPLLYEDFASMPKTLKFYTHLKYNPQSDGLVDFWGKLAASIRNMNSVTPLITPIIQINDSNISLSSSHHSMNMQTDSNLMNLPTPPNELPIIKTDNVPSISAENIHEFNHHSKFKKLSPFRNSNNNLVVSNGNLLRNAHSTSQLNAGRFHESASMLSIASCTSDSNELTTKKKKKFRGGKLLKKVFSRSSSKLQQPA